MPGTSFRFTRIITIIIIFLMIISFEHVFAQISGNELDADTSRFLPEPQEILMGKWQINFQKFNVQSRNFHSSSNRGYRMLVDLNSSPKTALTFNITITLVREGTIIDEKRGRTVPNVHFVFRKFFDMSSMGHYMPAQLSKYGDESFEAMKDYDKYRIFFRRGQYLIDIIGTDNLPDRKDKPDVQQVSRYLAYFIDSRIFGARIGIFRPIQVLDSRNIPMISGKRMVIYSTVEVQKKEKFPSNYLLTVTVGMQGFRKTSYSIPLGLKGKTIFGPAGSTTDGALWADEYGEPVPLTKDFKSYFGILNNPNYETYLYRFYIDPKKPDRIGDYIFKVNLIDPNGSKLREHVYKYPLQRTRKLRVAIMPLPIGYWSHAKDWKVDEWSWISRLGDQAWKRQSYISFVASVPEGEREKFLPKPLGDYLRKHLFTSKGKRRYEEKVKEGKEFLMGAFPIDEENFEIYVYEEFPEDLKITPHLKDIKKICSALDKWREKHPRFDRVIGISPGSSPLRGGVSFYLDNNTGRQLWYRKNSVVISVYAPAFQFAHDLAHTFGALDEYPETDPAKPAGRYTLPPLNKPVGVESGAMVNNGYWPAKEIFMGTPLRPVNSIMGIREPAWIPGDIYKGIMKQLVY